MFGYGLCQKGSVKGALGPQEEDTSNLECFFVKSGSLKTGDFLNANPINTRLWSISYFVRKIYIADDEFLFTDAHESKRNLLYILKPMGDNSAL